MTKAHEINLARMASRGTGTSQLGPGDLVEITIVSGAGDEEVKPCRARVSSDGAVAVPIIGVVEVGGLEPFAAEERIAAAAVQRGIYRRPYVTLSVAQQAVNRVTVMGSVEKPGVVELPRGSSDLLSALAAAGGMKQEASMQVDVLRHGSDSQTVCAPAGTDKVQLASYSGPAIPQFGPPALVPPPGSLSGNAASVVPLIPEATRIDLAQADRPSSNYQLGDRDVVMVHAKEKRMIHVTGLVAKPDQYEMPYDKDLRVLDAIAMAGGVRSPLADKVFVIRQFPEMPKPAVIKLSMAAAKRNGDSNLLLASGDLVSVEATPITMMSDAATNFFRVAIGLSGSIVTF